MLYKAKHGSKLSLCPGTPHTTAPQPLSCPLALKPQRSQCIPRCPVRLLQERVEWTKCVFAASAEAVEAENLFFVLGGPTSYMYT